MMNLITMSITNKNDTKEKPPDWGCAEMHILFSIVKSRYFRRMIPKNMYRIKNKGENVE